MAPRDRDSGAQRLEGIVDGLMASYCKHGGINHLEGPNLPSKASIRALSERLQALLFPGFSVPESMGRMSLRYSVGQRAADVLESLSEEAAKSFVYQARLQRRRGDRQALDVQACAWKGREVAFALLEALPGIRQQLQLDAEAALYGDPAAGSLAEVLLSYPGMHALTVHRVAHFLYRLDVPLIPRMMAELVHSETGIDIHPGATIGRAFFIDHGTGVVIGETARIGDRVKLYQGVTLGALSVSRAEWRQDAPRRHPLIEDDVTIYAGATILGGQTVIGAGSIIGGNVWLTRSVPAGTKVVFEPPRLRYQTTPQSADPSPSVPRSDERDALRATPTLCDDEVAWTPGADHP